MRSDIPSACIARQRGPVPLFLELSSPLLRFKGRETKKAPDRSGAFSVSCLIRRLRSVEFDDEVRFHVNGVWNVFEFRRAQECRFHR